MCRSSIKSLLVKNNSNDGINGEDSGTEAEAKEEKEKSEGLIIIH